MPPDPPPIQGQGLSSLDRFWLDTIREAAKESVRSLEETAKQLIAVASFSQTVYFAAISFSDLKKAQGQMSHQWPLVIALVVPLLFWVISLWFAIRVFNPEAYETDMESPEEAREAYQRIVAYKRSQLRLAHYALLVGFGPLLINLILYLAFIPPPPKQ